MDIVSCSCALTLKIGLALRFPLGDVEDILIPMYGYGEVKFGSSPCLLRTRGSGNEGVSFGSGGPIASNYVVLLELMKT